MDKLLIENGFSDLDAAGLTACLKPVKHSYKKGDIIRRYSAEENEIGIMLKGTAFLVSINSDGQKSIIDCFGRGDAFSARLSPQKGINAYYVTAKTSCDIMYINYDRLITGCPNCCEKHAALVDLILGSSVRRGLTHIDILSQRSTGAKLLCFFEYLSEKENSREITLPMSYSDLADYISVDRSAMMREIKRLGEEGVIRSEGKKIRLTPTSKI